MTGGDADCGFGITTTFNNIGGKTTGGNLTVCYLNLR